MTAFSPVPLVLTVVSLVLGTIIGVLGVRVLLVERRAAPAGTSDVRDLTQVGTD